MSNNGLLIRIGANIFPGCREVAFLLIVESVDSLSVTAWHKVSVRIDCLLDRSMSELVANVGK